jgi:hypothetical protein
MCLQSQKWQSPQEAVVYAAAMSAAIASLESTCSILQWVVNNNFSYSERFLAVLLCRLDQLAAEMHVRVFYAWCAAPKEECRARVEAQPVESPARQAARLHIIGSVDEQWFEPRPMEAANLVLGPA